MPSFAKFDASQIKNKVILLDIDGTVIHDGHDEIGEDILNKVEELRNNRNKIYLCSSQEDHYRHRALAKFLKVEYIEANLHKPTKKILKLISKPKTKKLVVIGDKYLVDGRLAKVLRAEFVKVGLAASVKESFIRRIFYKIDDLFNDLLGG